MSNPEGKVVAEFLYSPKTRKRGTQVRVPVRLIQDVKRDKVYGDREELGDRRHMLIGHTQKAVFQVLLEDPKKIDLRGTDIEVLRAAVFDALDKAYELDWVEYLHIRISRPSIWSGSGEGIEITYEDVEIAKLDDGTEVYRIEGRYGTEVMPGRPETGKDKRSDDMRSLVLATPQNVAAVKEFCSRIKELHRQLAKFLAPDVIAANLQDLGQRLLPAMVNTPNPKTNDNKTKTSA